ncbi:aminotransferase class V-fold PLP-dependent enzyme [Frankia sp. R82]|uniref:pyridoxal phosphate-dependent decarboxylase family protein n=1 Tax=Frankia sp. R82 TaxID=2950553 RepID=UPI002042E4C2|nr:aminotransferase class V-fold PLP-dependent enzyme [Frankia sp. R82]MCM3883261.1 aminotransferase class V-fold PLP-dependent enzyme [Frankia sp. R82]
MWDQTPVLHVSSPAAAVVEEIVAGWLVRLFGLPATTSVGLTSGCATANLVALAAARHQVLTAAGWDPDRQGLIGAPAPRILVSRGCHVTVPRALRVLGLGGQIHPVDTDTQGRMRLDRLAEVLAATTGPLVVCAQVGTVDTGAVDAVAEIGALTHAHGGWLHVDAAFGMWAAASPRLRAAVPGLAGLAAADSWATDAHKWLNVPYDCGVVLCRHPDAHRAAVRAQADYLSLSPPSATVPAADRPTDAGPVDPLPAERHPAEYTLEMSRRARALVLWATLRHLGTDGVTDLVERCCALAARMATRLAGVDGATVVGEVVLNQVLVRFTPPHPGVDPMAGHPDRPAGPAASVQMGDSANSVGDAHTAAVVAAFQRSGVGWASPTRWQGRTMLRLSVCNWQTDEADVDAAVAALVDAHQRLAAGFPAARAITVPAPAGEPPPTVVLRMVSAVPVVPAVPPRPASDEADRVLNNPVPETLIPEGSA